MHCLRMVYMKLKADYHIHSTYSKNNHGKSTIEEIVQRAIDVGLKEIAVTDHGPGHLFFGIRKKDISKAKNEIIELRKKYPQIKILFGVEANILSYEGDIDLNDELNELCDIILCGYHLGVKYKSFSDFWNFYVLNFLAKFSKNLHEKQKVKNTEAVVNALNRNKIDILTHPGDKISVDIDKVAYAAEQNNTKLEISNHHDHLNSEEIKTAAKYDVRFLINSDSHIKENIGKFEKALKEATDAELDLNRIINLSVK